MKRLENGLIEGLNYIRDEKTGKIDWFKTLPKEPEYIYINQDRKKQVEAYTNKTFEETKIEEVKEQDLILTLKGIRWLLDVRGYKYVKFNTISANAEYAATTCEICFLPNDGENFEQVFTGSACAHFQNTGNFATKYLLEISSNRALCRATRLYLNISAVSREELGASISEPEQPKSVMAPARQLKLLEDIMGAKGVLWKHLEDKMKTENTYKEEYKSVNDLPKDLVFQFIERLKKMPST